MLPYARRENPPQALIMVPLRKELFRICLWLTFEQILQRR